ncbi:hypothetical protein AJ88_34590 [Mesorhizobium amorphae CCBAU 01583]|nr:hypothetical protein AJ88_34590 [Mesorhizobium amorphae CCBAU 01583]
MTRPRGASRQGQLTFRFIGFGGLIDLSPIVAVSTHKLSCLVRRDVMRFDNVAHFRLLAF